MRSKAKGHAVEVINAGVSGDTTAGGLERVAWAVPERTDAVILELGANDALRGLDPGRAKANLEKIITTIKAGGAEVLLAGMLAPRNMGEDYVRRFNAIYPDLAKKHGLILYPFFLDGVALNGDLNLGDGIHPNPKGVAEITKRILPSGGRADDAGAGEANRRVRRVKHMPRLFTALEIPEMLRTRLSLMRAPLNGAKWVDAENMHITLRFAGDIDGRTADDFADLLAEVSGGPFQVSIAGAGAFGGRDPRVLWAGVETGPELDALYRANERAARAAGLDPDPRDFRPHVTLARMRGARHGRGGAIPGGKWRSAAGAVHGHALRAVLGAAGLRRAALCG